MRQESPDTGFSPSGDSLVKFMANQEVGHATLLTNMLGEAAPKQCVYNYPYTTASMAIDCDNICETSRESR
jgi:hypothetical protein